jgi:hypothetical protein
MERFLCIHGHFYQPPRENPRLESIEIQDSAFPYHEWNIAVDNVALEFIILLYFSAGAALAAKGDI